MTRILVTGGAGYVGSHTVLVLLQEGYEVMVIDNMVNAVLGSGGKPESLNRVEKITGKTVDFEIIDLMDLEALRRVVKTKGPFESCIHFAALKSVGESCQQPLRYYRNNGTGSINLLEVLGENNCKSIIFSSSATVYGDPQYLPLDEKHPTGSCTNPYGKTKFIMEEIMRDVCTADPEWKAIMLRYFNPVGAHASGLIGEDPLGIPNNLMPFIAQVAVGRRKALQVFGNDYDTPDGTGVRDYIHVMDLAVGHVAAVRRAKEDSFKGWKAFNLGTGKGNSVLQMVAAFEAAAGNKIAYDIVPRRSGDIATSYADCSLAATELKWTAKKTIADMCADTWRWQSGNPKGFAA
ncbi:unnamed protein product [Allacma fusca]|uniref:UDP-glucose 4-epimerase n=1 Tax=Allacma fusca TaxID=39272 RepID=A0A8J2IXX3_9HEXA|nr:unnamed protein product [Allacma fusca]